MLGTRIQDDAITEALNRCAKPGSIVLPANQTFSVRSSLALSPCQACGFKIDRVLSITPDWHYWENQTAVIKVLRTTTAVVSSNGTTGAIDANNFGWTGHGSLPR